MTTDGRASGDGTDSKNAQTQSPNDAAVGIDARFADETDQPETAAESAASQATDAPQMIQKQFVLGADMPAMMASSKTWTVPRSIKSWFFLGTVLLVPLLVSYKACERARYEEILVE